MRPPPVLAPPKRRRTWALPLATAGAVTVVVILGVALSAARDGEQSRRDMSEAIDSWLPQERAWYDSEEGWWLSSKHREEQGQVVYTITYAVRIEGDAMVLRIGEIAYRPIDNPLAPGEQVPFPEDTRWGTDRTSATLIREGRSIRAHFPAEYRYDTPYDIHLDLLGGGDAMFTITQRPGPVGGHMDGDNVPIMLDSIKSHFVPSHQFDLVDVFEWHSAVRAGRPPKDVTASDLAAHRH